MVVSNVSCGIDPDRISVPAVSLGESITNGCGCDGASAGSCNAWLSGPVEVVPVRINPELRAAIEARAEADHTTSSEIIREAIRRFLEVA